jgi:hypothetical protein
VHYSSQAVKSVFHSEQCLSNIRACLMAGSLYPGPTAALLYECAPPPGPLLAQPASSNPYNSPAAQSLLPSQVWLMSPGHYEVMMSQQLRLLLRESRCMHCFYISPWRTPVADLWLSYAAQSGSHASGCIEWLPLSALS